MTVVGAGGDDRVPVTVVTGCLGSGKTTLLSALLRRPENGRIAVIINEFGEVPLDQALIERKDAHVVVLSGGCLCCAVVGDLVSTLVDLYRRRTADPFDRVVIETSGLADPGPILAPLIQAPELASLFRVEGVVALVDALQGLRELGRQRVSVKQVSLADRIILTKSDIAAPRAVAALRDLLAGINPWASLLEGNHGAVDSGWFFAPGIRLPPASQAQTEHAHHHGDHLGIRSFCLWFDRPLNWSAFAQAATALTEDYGEKILRVKGLLNIDGRPTAFHGVQHFHHPPTPLTAWPDSDHRSRLVFITDQVEAAAVRPFFASLIG